MDLGFEAAGCQTVVAVELDPEAVATLQHNRDWPVLNRDIHEIGSQELLAVASLKPGEADILIGGPPCQPFSKSGYWASGDTSRLDDPRAGTLREYLRVLRDTLPRCFLLENVPGLAYRQKSEGLELIRSMVAEINQNHGTQYQISLAKLNAADYGIPQMRERVFVIGERTGSSFSFPTPTHSNGGMDTLSQSRSPYVTAWEAIGDLQENNDPELALRGKWADLLPSIPEGENYLWHTERGGGLPLFGWRRRYWSFLLKLSKRAPSWTIQAHPGPAVGPFHWKNRKLSQRELCRIQTIPDDYTVLGPYSTVQRQVGNAVPSTLAELLARAMRRQFLGHKVDVTVSLPPRARSPIPAPEPVQQVPRQYRHLAGKHSAHPGTSKRPDRPSVEVHAQIREHREKAI